MMKSKENYNSILIRFCLCGNIPIVFSSFVSSLVVLVVFSALVVSIHHLWFRFILIYGLRARSNIHLLLSFLNEQHEEKGADLMLSFSLVRPSSSVRFIRPNMPSLSRPCLRVSRHFVSRMLRFTRRTGSLSVCFIKSNEIFLHTEKKSRIVAYKNEIEEKIIMCNFETQNIIQP